MQLVKAPSRRSLLVRIAVVVLFLVGGSAVLVTRLGGYRAGGPLDVAGPLTNGDTAQGAPSPDAFLVLGGVAVTNSGKQPLVIERVETTDVTGDVRKLWAGFLPARGGWFLAACTKQAPPDHLRPGSFRVMPSEGFFLYIGVESPRHEGGRVPGLRVYYRVGGKSFVRSVKYGASVDHNKTVPCSRPLTWVTDG